MFSFRPAEGWQRLFSRPSKSTRSHYNLPIKHFTLSLIFFRWRFFSWHGTTCAWVRYRRFEYKLSVSTWFEIVRAVANDDDSAWKLRIKIEIRACKPVVRREAKTFPCEGKVFFRGWKTKKNSSALNSAPRRQEVTKRETQNNSNQYENNESAHLSQLGRRLPGDGTEGKRWQKRQAEHLRERDTDKQGESNERNVSVFLSEYFWLNSEIFFLHKFALVAARNDYCKQPVIKCPLWSFKGDDERWLPGPFNNFFFFARHSSYYFFSLLAVFISLLRNDRQKDSLIILGKRIAKE